jgi:hypothetical protein
MRIRREGGEGRLGVPIAGGLLVGLVLCAGLAVLGTVACQRDQLAFSSKTPGTPEELLVELKDHQQKIDKATDDMMKRIDEFNQTRKPGQRTIQFTELFTQDLSDAQRDVLNQMIAQEKDVSFKSLLEKIATDRDALQKLQEKVMHLEQSLPDQFVVAKKGDKQRQLAMNYLINDAHVEPAAAKTLLAQVDTSDELVPGNKVWFFYDQPRDTFRTYITQGEAGRTPLAVRRANQRKLVKERDEAAAARDTAQAEVADLQQTKSQLETDIAGLQQNKAELEANVDKLSNDLSFRQNSLFYHAANVHDLRTQRAVTALRKRLYDVKSVHFDTALDLRAQTTITFAPDAFGLEKIDSVRVLPSIYQEGRDFTVETSDSGIATIKILDPELFKGKEVVFAVGG